MMSQGRVVECGPAQQSFSAPQHEYTRALFAAAPGRDDAFGAAAAYRPNPRTASVGVQKSAFNFPILHTSVFAGSSAVYAS